MNFCLNVYSNYIDNINASVVVDDILAKINLKNTFFVTKVCRGINNAVAIKVNGVKYILLDVEWMESLKSGKNDWFQLSVIGHEVGHHLLNHTEKLTFTLQESRKNELAADEFSGYLLGMYGAKKKDVDSLLINLPNDTNKNSTHPQKKEREIAFMKGFNSSKKNETSILIQSLTKNVDFDIKRVPYLLSLARNKFSSYLDTNNKNILLQAIEAYQEAIRFSTDPQIAYELGGLFLSNGEREKYYLALELAYQKTKDEKFILELIGHAISCQDLTTDNIILKYGAIVKDINSEKFYEPICISSIANYFMYMATKNQAKDAVDFSYVSKAESFCKIALKNYESRPEDTDMLGNRAEINSTLGLCEQLRENYEISIKYFNSAKTDFESAKKYDSRQENIFCYFSLNLLAVNYNIALSSIRLREWQNGLDSIANYENIINSLSQEKKDYVTSMDKTIPYKSFYLNGRCYHGLGLYAKAIEAFTNAINYESNSSYLFYYRGISFLGLEKNSEACSDFEISCKKGESNACNRYNNCK